MVPMHLKCGKNIELSKPPFPAEPGATLAMAPREADDHLIQNDGFRSFAEAQRQGMDDPFQHLHGRHVLVVEDEASIAVMMESALCELGCRVHTAQTLGHALALAANRSIDCALLDVRLGDDTVFSVADVLAEHRIPFVFSSGYGKDALPARYQGHKLLSKPFLFADVASALGSALIDGRNDQPQARARFHVVPAAGDGPAEPDGLPSCQDAGSTGRPGADPSKH